MNRRRDGVLLWGLLLTLCAVFPGTAAADTNNHFYVKQTTSVANANSTPLEYWLGVDGYLIAPGPRVRTDLNDFSNVSITSEDDNSAYAEDGKGWIQAGFMKGASIDPHKNYSELLVTSRYVECQTTSGYLGLQTYDLTNQSGSQRAFYCYFDHIDGGTGLPDYYCKEDNMDTLVLRDVLLFHTYTMSRAGGEVYLTDGPTESPQTQMGRCQLGSSNPSYGLHLKGSGTWYLWTTSLIHGGTYAQEATGVGYHGHWDNAYSAFTVWGPDN